jgi:hypothetical protein
MCWRRYDDPGQLAGPPAAGAVAGALRAGPQDAAIRKRARTLDGHDTDPLHGLVAPDPAYDVAWPYGIDRAVGGLHDAPNPGELLCVALAACHDASMRMVADLLGIHLLDLKVEVTTTWTCAAPSASTAASRSASSR